jgi:hypothetical protein
VVVSIFGESAEDRRDFRMGLAGLLAGVHALRILAERGVASPADIRLSTDGIGKMLDQITTWKEGERERLDSMLRNLVEAAELNFGKTNG